MKNSRLLLAGCTALILSAAATVAAQQGAKAPATAPQGAKAPTAPSAVDPDALAALEKMGAALRARNTFVMNADVTTEDVLDSGEKLQFAGTLEVQARRPDRFRLSAVSDLRDRQIYYDGKSVTVHAPKLGVYASFAAPATIAQTLQIARERYDIELPLADLFTWGTDVSAAAKLTSGFLVRPETIGGRSCNHYAFRQENVDWQIWIATAEPALPCKLVITNTEDDSRPQYTAVLRWSFPPTVAENVFAFAAPASSAKIVIVDLASKQASGATK
jgi:hypothetical protein